MFAANATSHCATKCGEGGCALMEGVYKCACSIQGKLFDEKDGKCPVPKHHHTIDPKARVKGLIQ